MTKILNAARYAGYVVQCLLSNPNLRRATKYLTRDLTVKATRRLRANRRMPRHDFYVTVGRPNYSERRFIKACVKAGEPFPVKNIQLQAWPKKHG